MQTSHSDLSLDALWPLLRDCPQVTDIHYYPHTTSTNTLAQLAAQQQHTGGLLILTDHQSAGRGQHGRSWLDAPGQSLLASWLLRPHWLAPQHTPLLINAFVATLAEAIAHQIAHPVAIKWPNDLVVARDGQYFKVGGVLCEGQIQGGVLQSVCLGFGINVRYQPEQVVDGIDVGHTSRPLSHWQPDINRQALLVDVVARWSQTYATLATDATAYQPRWRALVIDLVGQQVRLRQADTEITGVVHALNDDGSLMLEAADGRTQRVTSGMLTWWSTDHKSGTLPHHPSE